MHLFDDGGGITADSTRFFRDNRHLLGDIVEAQVFFPGSGGPLPYSCVLGDADGNKMWLSGLAAGYPGEGPRAAMQVLVESGFDAIAAREVFTHSPVRLRREASTERSSAAGAFDSARTAQSVRTAQAAGRTR